MLAIKAVSITESGLDSYFSVNVDYVNNSNNVVVKTEKVVFKVEVRDTFAQRAEGRTAFYVGYKLNGNGNEVLGTEEKESINGTEHAPILTIRNNTTFSVDMNDYLVGRALFNTNDHSKVVNNTSENKYWTIKSATNFTIGNVGIFELTQKKIDNVIKISPVAYNKDTNTAPIRVAPSFTGSVNITAQDISVFNIDNPGKSFWNTTFRLQVPLIQVGTEVTVNVWIPFRFEPANPVKRSISANILSLNLSSNYMYDLSSQKYTDLTAEDPSTAITSSTCSPTTIPP